MMMVVGVVINYDGDGSGCNYDSICSVLDTLLSILHKLSSLILKTTI